VVSLPVVLVAPESVVLDVGAALELLMVPPAPSVVRLAVLEPVVAPPILLPDPIVVVVALSSPLGSSFAEHAPRSNRGTQQAAMRRVAGTKGRLMGLGYFGRAASAIGCPGHGGHARYRETQGLGHKRILSTAAVGQSVAGFLDAQPAALARGIQGAVPKNRRADGCREFSHAVR
jgi:hypothetical protein